MRITSNHANNLPDTLKFLFNSLGEFYLASSVERNLRQLESDFLKSENEKEKTLQNLKNEIEELKKGKTSTEQKPSAFPSSPSGLVLNVKPSAFPSSPSGLVLNVKHSHFSYLEAASRVFTVVRFRDHEDLFILDSSGQANGSYQRSPRPQESSLSFLKPVAKSMLSPLKEEVQNYFQKVATELNTELELEVGKDFGFDREWNSEKSILSIHPSKLYSSYDRQVYGFYISVESKSGSMGTMVHALVKTPTEWINI